jgi:hypothetical protein
VLRDYRCAARKRDAAPTSVGCLERTAMRTRPDFMQHEEGSRGAQEHRFDSFGYMDLRRIQFCSAADAAATALMQLPDSSWRQKATSGPFQLAPEPHVSALAQMSCTCGRARVELTMNSEMAELAPVDGTSSVPLPPPSTRRSSSLYGRPNSPASFVLAAKSLLGLGKVR